MDDIAGAIRARAPDARLPEPGVSKWQRFPCPFCGKPRAVISYAIEWFKCFSCGEVVPDYAEAGGRLAYRFGGQITYAVRNVCKKYGNWISGEDAEDMRQYAYEVLAGFDKSGELDDWESGVNGDPGRLDAYVFQALNGDLLNWAQSLRRRKERELMKTPGGIDNLRSQVRAKEESPEDAAMWIGFPILKRLIRDKMTVREVAVEFDVSVWTVRRWRDDELAEAGEAEAALSDRYKVYCSNLLHWCGVSSESAVTYN